jgi:putative peptidoglycan lipid II flippase
MIAGTIVTLASVPIYWSLYRSMGASGLAVASDIGILIQTITLAVLLNKRRMVPLAGLEYAELLRSTLAAVLSLAALFAFGRYVHTTSRLYELLLLAAATLIWLAISTAVLKLTGSALPSQLLSRFAGTHKA